MKTLKKFLSMAALTLVGAMMTGCSNDDDSIIDTPQQTENKSNVVTLTTTVGLDSNGEAGARSATRALTSGGVKTFNADETMAIVYKNTSGTTVKAVSAALKAGDITNDGKNATFTFELENPDRTQNVTYIYPAAMANSDGSINYAALNSQNGTLATLASNLDLATYSGAWNAGTLPTGTLENRLAILAYTLKNVDGSNDITNTITDMTVTDGTYTYAVSRSAADGPIYVAIRPTSSANIAITATAGTAKYEKSLTGKTYEAGNGYSISLKMLPAVTDLSMVDCAGNARDKQWTANCYMVHTAGDYKLPLVYGNAIKASQTNAAAYTGVENANTTLFFPRHDGSPITGPWIKDNGIAVNSAELLWQDAEGLVTDVDIDGDYLTLTVGTDAATQEGNAVIAAKTADGTIVWSWHIWVTKQTFATLTEVNTSSHTYWVTPVNLGWVGDATSATGGYNTYYQWGRKDAFIPSNPIPSTGGDNTNHTVYDIDNAPVSGFSNTRDRNVTIGGNIQNPTVHNYIFPGTYGPCNTRYYNMWDAQQTSTDIAAAATKKTVYDPCPPGFCVPTIGLYNYIISQNRPTWNTGYTYPATNGVFFPASGSRSNGSGVLGGVGASGYCWSATPGDGANGRNFNFNSSSWSLSSSQRAVGCPVRAVAE